MIRENNMGKNINKYYIKQGLSQKYLIKLSIIKHIMLSKIENKFFKNIQFQ